MPTVSLRGTALDSLAGRRFVCAPSDAARAFPEDAMIARGGYQSFVGVALAGATGEQIGLLAGLWSEPLSDVPGTTAAFLIVARQVAHILADLLAERELRESEQRYGSVFEGSAIPILLVEPQTTQIVDANPAACSLYGYPREELVTMSILQVDALAAETVQAELQRALDGSRSNFIGRHMLSGGRVRDVEVSIGPITVGGRQLLYAMVHDVTERKRMEAEVERDMVFVNLAQELRTSLQTITGFSDLLLGGTPGDLNKEQKRQVEMIQQAGRRLTAFATTLIETHRVEAADLTCEPEEFDLVGLVESVLFGLASFAEDKGLSLTLVADERPITIETDRYKLQQILLNLLSNAIRYTERGGVTVTVARDGDKGATVAVADTGPGMPSERVVTLFDGPEVHDSAAGIGLPASRRIATLLGGTIGVESVLSKGSVFTVWIPMHCVEAPQPAEG
jgi:PAS domain S-box-containing protein